MAETVDEDLRILDAKIKQVKLEYDQYFLGTRPREPSQLRAEIQKQVTILTQTPFQNTALRFRFNSLCSRFQVFKRQWDETLRKIEQGTYQRQVFRANLHERERGLAPPPSARKGGAGQQEGLFEAYKEAAQACGQNVAGLTPQKLQAVVAKQEKAIRERYGVDQVKFRVVVQEGRVKLKAAPVRS
ncbi:MAG: hypothetical protein MJE66_12760 [Proteobacteria bacterium]|nr:hypothetical protein [Pseudomonadota bacterium]